MKQTLILFFGCLLFLNCDLKPDDNNITTKELKELITSQNIQLLDVRTPKEQEVGFIKNAIFINFSQKDFNTTVFDKLDKNKPVYVYCKSGNRSKKGTKYLTKQGYKAYNILGGYEQWNKEN